jgi:hypothetical protein
MTKKEVPQAKENISVIWFHLETKRSEISESLRVPYSFCAYSYSRVMEYMEISNVFFYFYIRNILSSF